MRFYITALSIYSTALTVLVIMLIIQNQALKSQKTVPSKPDSAEVHKINVQDIPFLGAPDSPVVMVAFSDFECPACARGSENMRRILEEFPDQVKIGFKVIPDSRHPNGAEAASAALSAYRQGKFWEMEQNLFDNQHRLNQDLYHELAESIGLEMSSFEAFKDLDYWHDYLAAQRKEAKSLQITATPTFFVNGVKVKGTSYEELKSAVQYLLNNKS